MSSRVCQRCQHVNTSEAKFCLQCGAMLEVEVENAGDPLIGKILMGRYRVSKVLGEGGMGKVYLAEQKMGTAVRKVAIKTLHQELITDPQLVARFHRECETVIELHHPNTVQFYDFGELEDKTLFIVMEFIEGEDLAHVLQRGALDLGRADRILIQVCGSLNEAHQRGIVHRDLKPENVLLTQRGGQSDFVKVLDFGIAKRNEAEDESKAKLTKQGTVLGTPPYMSPEQFSGQALDLRSDIYSLGVMTYEMVTGHLPFEARTPWEWATKHLTQPPTPIESYPQGAMLPPNKRNAIMRALAKNREERHGNVIDFMQEFTGLADAQSAWTMATSAGLKNTPGLSSGQVAAAMAHTQPSAMVSPPYGQTSFPPSQPGGYAPTPYGTGGVPVAPMSTPSHGQSATPFPNTQPSMAGMNPSMPTVPTSGSSGIGKILAVLAVLLVVVGGGAAAYFAFGGDETTATTGTVVATTGTVPPANLPPVATTGTPVAGDPNLQANQVGAGVVDAGTTAAAVVDAGTTQNVAAVVDAGTASTPRQDPPNTAMQDARDEPSAADLERARAAVRDAESAIGRNDVEGAVRALAAAQRAVGRSHPVAAGARGNLARVGGRMVGIMIQQNKCAMAQSIYRQLRTVGADSSARGQFVPGYCDRP